MLYEIRSRRRLDHPGDGQAALAGPSAALESYQLMQGGPKHLISACSFVKERSLEGHGFYVHHLPCPLCFTEEGKKWGDILQIREGPEVSDTDVH